MSFGIHKEERGHCISPFPKMTSSDPDLVCFTALLFGGEDGPTTVFQVSIADLADPPSDHKTGGGNPPDVPRRFSVVFPGPLVPEETKPSAWWFTQCQHWGWKYRSQKATDRRASVDWHNLQAGQQWEDHHGAPRTIPSQTPSRCSRVGEARICASPRTQINGRSDVLGGGVLPRPRWTVAVLYAVLKDEDRPGREKGGKQGLFPHQEDGTNKGYGYKHTWRRQQQYLCVSSTWNPARWQRCRWQQMLPRRHLEATWFSMALW